MVATDETPTDETHSLSTIDVAKRIEHERQAECIHVPDVSMIPPAARNHLQAKADEIERAFQTALGVSEPTTTNRDTTGLFTKRVVMEAFAPVDDDVDTERVAEITDEYEQRFADAVADVREQWADWEPPQTVSDADGVGFEPWDPTDN